MLLHLQVFWIWFIHASIGGAPLWLLVGLGLAALAKYVIKRAQWTRAQSLFEAVFRLVVKTPLVGAIVVRVPLVGWCFVYLAGDAEGLPEAELLGFLSALMGKKADPPPPTQATAEGSSR